MNHDSHHTSLKRNKFPHSLPFEYVPTLWERWHQAMDRACAEAQARPVTEQDWQDELERRERLVEWDRGEKTCVHFV